jgi:hypothetical protein
MEAAATTLGALHSRVMMDRDRHSDPAEALHAEACRAIARVVRASLSRGNVRVIHESEAAE